MRLGACLKTPMPLDELTLLVAGCSSETAITFQEREGWIPENVLEVNVAQWLEISLGRNLILGVIVLDVGVDTGPWSQEMLIYTLNQLDIFS